VRLGVVAVLLPCLALLVVALLVLEVRRYRTGRHLISARRLALRLAAGALLLGLLTAIFAGLFLLRLTEADGREQLFLAYWGGCLVFAFVLMFLMVADMREVEQRSTQRQHEIWRDFARYLAGKSGPDRADPSPEDKGKL